MLQNNENLNLDVTKNTVTDIFYRIMRFKFTFIVSTIRKISKRNLYQAYVAFSET